MTTQQFQDEIKGLKQFALKVHNFAYGTKWDDEDIVSAMDFDCIIEKMQKDEKELEEYSKVEGKEEKEKEYEKLAYEIGGEFQANNPSLMKGMVKLMKSEIEKLKEEIEYWRCWANWVDPNCKAECITKEHIDGWTTDPQKRAYLYEQCSLDTDDEDN